MEIIKAEEQKEKRLNKSRQSLFDTIKKTKILIVGDPEGEEKEAERIFEEIMAENLSSLMKKNLFLQLAQ